MDHTNVSHQRWHDHRLFLSHFTKSPRTVGAIAPSSQSLARTMLDGLTLEDGVKVVELGPGTGAITGEIARRLPARAICLAIDINPEFTARVAAKWPRIDAICDRAERLVEIASARDALPVDHIVSGLPFASLPGETARAIVDAIVAALRPGGTFTTFQYAHAFGFSSASMVRETLTRRMGARPTRRFVISNLPPALVVRWTKRAVNERP
ncbi:MAG TPA: methyltransferase domain-containing protein [Vicinamibacterales bacterium]|nr:methyltransferase domain-containing protein [Vicinamibacterales bacterium]